MTARALFVLGAPRSGTSVIGSLLASSPEALDLGEYRGFFLSYWYGEKLFSRTATRFNADYKLSLCQHAKQFAEMLAYRQKTSWFVDHTPMNLLIADHLSTDIQDALFVLVVRHHAGVIQSLGRSFKCGYKWAGGSLEERADLYAKFYECASHLPINRTVAISYDALAANPRETISKFERSLSAHGFNTNTLDRAVLANSHSTKSDEKRQTVGYSYLDRIHLQSIPSYDSNEWSEASENICKPRVESAIEILNELCPNMPSKPYPGSCFQ